MATTSRSPLAPHALQARLELLLHELPPLLALLAAAAPVELEQHVRVEVREHLVEVDRDLADAPERRLGDGDVGPRGRAHRLVVGRSELGLRALLAQLASLEPRLVEQLGALVGLDELVHHGEAGERVLAVEDAGVVDLVGLAALRVQDAAPEVAVDRGAADQHGVLEAALVQLLHRQRHLLGGRDEQRGQADRRRLVLLRGVEDRPDRDLLAEIDDAVAVVGEDRVDE
jgi:hypothetical protein